VNYRAARMNIRVRKRRMGREANRLAAQAQRFADCISIGSPYSRDAADLLELANRVVMNAAWLDATQETLDDVEEE